MFPAIPVLDESVIGQMPAIGIGLALIGALFMSLGAQFQHRGVDRIEESHGTGERGDGLSVRQLLLLLRRPAWVVGSVLLALAIALQLTALGFAPLIVVQPLGAVALVITALLNARITHVRLAAPALRAIGLCVGGVAIFVTVATFVAKEHPVGQLQLIVILVILVVVIALLATAFALFRNRAGAIFYIISAGVLYGFVATLAKVVINRLGNEMAGMTEGHFEWLTIVCIVGMLSAAALGGYFVQTAYSVGSPDLVIAGLTVIDPLIAISIGIVVLGEASEAPWWAIPIWLIAGALAVIGVFQLAKHHPQTHR